MGITRSARVRAGKGRQSDPKVWSKELDRQACWVGRDSIRGGTKQRDLKMETDAVM